MLSNLHITSRNLRCCVLVNQIQGISQQATKPNVDKIKCDYIGPVDVKSNLRQHVRHIPETESRLQRRLREMRNAVDESNQLFWQKHNESFYNGKKAFSEQQRMSAGAEEMSADKISEFYKKFLDENHNRHVTYNRVWYKQNFQILILAFQVELESIFKRIRSKT